MAKEVTVEMRNAASALTSGISSIVSSNEGKSVTTTFTKEAEAQAIEALGLTDIVDKYQVGMSKFHGVLNLVNGELAANSEDATVKEANHIRSDIKVGADVLTGQFWREREMFNPQSKTVEVTHNSMANSVRSSAPRGTSYNGAARKEVLAMLAKD